jgi:hypothetical protein
LEDAEAEPNQVELVIGSDRSAASIDADDKSDDLTLAFGRLSNLPTYPLDRLSRYEATPSAAGLSDPVRAPVSRAA